MLNIRRIVELQKAVYEACAEKKCPNWPEEPIAAMSSILIGALLEEAVDVEVIVQSINRITETVFKDVIQTHKGSLYSLKPEIERRINAELIQMVAGVIESVKYKERACIKKGLSDMGFTNVDHIDTF